MSLYNFHRPKTFDEIVGNQAVVKSLKSIYEDRTSDFPAAVLLQGNSGTGKTSIARIIKEKLNCHDVDFQEINAANDRGIDTIRSISNIMYLSPLMGTSKVYLLDETSNLTKQSQQAILKMLEDPAPNVYFILCTTEPEKLLNTIRNRCNIFEMKPLNSREMKSLIKGVLVKEEFEIPEPVIDSIIKAADGCPRQALVILDSIIDMPEEDMIASIQSQRSTEEKVVALCQALMKQEPWSNITKIIQNLNDDPAKIRNAVRGYAAAVQMRSDQPNPVADLIGECFEQPFYDKSSLVFACARIYN